MNVYTEHIKMADNNNSVYLEFHNSPRNIGIRQLCLVFFILSAKNRISELQIHNFGDGAESV